MVVLDIASLYYLSALIGWWTLAVVFGGFLVGSFVLRSVGPYTGLRVARRLSKGDVPDRELVDALLMVAGGILCFLPGLASYALAALLILPGLRAIPRTIVLRGFGLRRGVAAAALGSPPSFGPSPEFEAAGGHAGIGDGAVIDAEYRRE